MYVLTLTIKTKSRFFLIYLDNPFLNLLQDPMFYYHASWACSKLKLKSQLAEYVCVGLLTVLIDMPYDINGATYVHWIWHDTDPNICMYSPFTVHIHSRAFQAQTMLFKYQCSTTLTTV